MNINFHGLATISEENLNFAVDRIAYYIELHGIAKLYYDSVNCIVSVNNYHSHSLFNFYVGTVYTALSKQGIIDVIAASLRCGAIAQSSIPTLIKDSCYAEISEEEHKNNNYNKSIYAAARLTSDSEIKYNMYYNLSNHVVEVYRIDQKPKNRAALIYIMTDNIGLKPTEIERFLLYNVEGRETGLFADIYKGFNISDLTEVQNMCHIAESTNKTLGRVAFAVSIKYDYLSSRISGEIIDIDKNEYKCSVFVNCGGYMKAPLMSEIAFLARKREKMLDKFTSWKSH